MELADIKGISQLGSGVNWSSLSNISSEDSKYAYATINGFDKGNAKPKSFVAELSFDVNSYDYDTDEVFLEYKMYVDDATQSLDGYSHLKHPNITFTFYDGSSYTIYQEDHCSDNYRDDFLVRNVKLDEELSLEKLNNGINITFEFDDLHSVINEDIIVYCDYIRLKIVSSLHSDEWGTHSIPYIVLPHSGFTIDADIFEKEYGAYGESYGLRDLPIGESFLIQYTSANLRDDEYTIIQLDDGMVFDESIGITSEDCSLNYDRNTNTIKIYSAEKTEGSLVFYIKLTHLFQQNLSVSTNYQDFTRVFKFNGTPPLIEGNISGIVSNGKLYLTISNYSSSEFDSLGVFTPLPNAIENANMGIQRELLQNGTTIGAGISLPQTGESNTYNIVADIGDYGSDVENIDVYLMEGDFYDGNLDIGDFSYTEYSIPVDDIPLHSSRVNVNPEIFYLRTNYPIDIFVGMGASELPLVADRGNYFKLDKPKSTIQIAKDIAFIGAVRLNRGHKADVVANTTNASSSESYQNRKYLGKTGDWKEEIGMTLRIPWQDVVTLQNHTYHDAPIPINTCPDLPDGDPLNHRGWAEIYGVKNIKKINDMLYQCEPEVEYLTHELLGKFNVKMLNRVCPKDIQYIIHTAHQYTDDVRDVMNLSSYRNFKSLEIDEYKYKGVYTVDDDNTYTFSTKEPISTISEWSFRWRNLLPTIDSNAHDDNRWQMAFRVLDHNTDELLFEYLYHNFKHINNNDELLNECDVKATRLNDDGEYEVTNFTHMNLDFDEVTASEYESKANTTLKVQQNIEIFERGHNVYLYLVDWNGNPLGNRFVDINVFDDDDNELQSFTVLTNSEGRAEFEFNQNKGMYRIQYKFVGDNDYNECFAESELFANISHSTYVYFDIENNQTFTQTGNYFEGYLRTGTNLVMNDEKVKIFVREGVSGKWKSTAYIVETDVTGKFRLQINLKTGTYQLKCVFKGYDDYTSSEEIATIKVSLKKGTATKLLTNDLIIPYLDGGNKSYTFDAILKTTDGKALPKQQVTFTFYNPASDNTKKYVVQTNNKGVASLKIGVNSGVYYVDTSFDGVNNKYKPCDNSNKIIVKARELINTQLSMNDMNITDCYHHELFATLVDENDNALLNYPVRFEITSLKDNETIKYTQLTNIWGMAELNINLPSGKYRCKAVFEGQDKYAPTQTYSDMVIKRPNLANVNLSVDNSAPYGLNQPIYITARNDDNQAIANLPIDMYIYDKDTTTIINHNRQIVTTYTKTTDTAEYETDSNGQLGFIPNIEAGTYTMRVVTYCNTQYNPREQLFTIVISENNKETTEIIPQWQGTDFKTYPFSRDEIRVRLVDSDGIALAGELLQYVWSTKTYDVVTDSGGYASLEVNQGQTYRQVTIRYQGNKAYSSAEITVNVDISNSNATSPSIIPQKTVVNMNLLTNYQTIEGVKTIQVTSFPQIVEVRLTSVNSNPLQNRTVSFSIWGENNENNTYYRTTNEEGIASFEFLTHTNNIYPAVIRYDNSEENAEDITFNLQVNVDSYELSSMIPTEMIDRGDTVAGLTTLETPDPETYNGTEYGSTLDMEFDNNILNIHDYGLVQNSQAVSGKVVMNNISLREGDYDIEVAVSYDAIDNLVQEMVGTMQINVYETKDILEYKSLYSSLFTAPALLPNYVCKFTRDGEDGRTYYYDGTTSGVTKQYNLSPFFQFKGGVRLETESGIDLFSINKAYSPIVLQNGFVKMAFHHRSGFIYVYKYRYEVDDNYADHSEWVLVRILQIKDYKNFKLVEYTQDKATIQFGECKFTMWRGRPFVQVEHEEQDIYFARQVDRVFCEINRNEMTFDYVRDSDVDKSLAEFKSTTGLNLFTYDLHIGQDITPENFGTTNVNLSTPYEKDREKGLKATARTQSIGLSGTTFPKQKFERPSDVFSLLINRFKTNADNIVIVLFGFDEYGSPAGVGVARHDISSSILHNGELNQVRIAFDVSQTDYKYFQFGVYMENHNEGDWFILNEMMLYKGDSTVPYEKDNYKDRLENSEIYFDSNYYANFYNKNDSFGLCILRPYLDDLKLSKIPSSRLTVLIPYFKSATLYDTPAMMTVEYLYFKEEKTELEGGDYGI